MFKMILYYFTHYLEKVEVIKLYNSILEEFTDFKQDKNCNRIGSYLSIFNRRKNFSLGEDRLNDLSKKFGEEIFSYYKNTTQFESEDEKVEYFFIGLFLRCLLEYYKSEEIELFVNVLPFNNFKEIEEIKEVLGSISEKKRKKMLLNYELVSITNGSLIPVNDFFNITESNAQVVFVNKYPTSLFCSIFKSGKIVLLKRCIESDIGLKRFIKTVFEYGLYKNCRGLWNGLLNKDDKRTFYRIVNLDLSRYKEKDDFLKFICELCLLSFSVDIFKVNQIGPISHIGEENLLSCLDKLFTSKYQECAKYYIKVIKDIPKKLPDLVYYFSPYFKNTKALKEYNKLLGKFIYLDYGSNKLVMSNKVHSSFNKKFYINDKHLEYISKLYDYDFTELYKKSTSFKSHCDSISYFFNEFYLLCLLKYYKEADVEIICEEAIPEIENPLLIDIKNVIMSMSAERRKVMLLNYEKMSILEKRVIVPHRYFKISVDDVPVTMVYKYPGELFGSAFLLCEVELLEKFTESEIGLRKFVDYISEANFWNFFDERFEDIVKHNDNKLLNRILELKFSLQEKERLCEFIDKLKEIKSRV